MCLFQPFFSGEYLDQTENVSPSDEFYRSRKEQSELVYKLKDLTTQQVGFDLEVRRTRVWPSGQISLNARPAIDYHLLFPGISVSTLSRFALQMPLICSTPKRLMFFLQIEEPLASSVPRSPIILECLYTRNKSVSFSSQNGFSGVIQALL